MRFFKLYRYMTEQTLREPMFRAALLITVLLLVAFSFIPRLPFPVVIIQISTILGFAYFIIATAGSIIEKTDKLSIELFLSKPFSRRDIILTDFLGTVTSVSCMYLLLSVGLWLIFGLRQNEWSPTLLLLSISMIIGFTALYCFIILTGLVVRNTAVVILFWVGYVYFGAVLLESRADLIYGRMNGWSYRLVADALYYIFPQVLSIARLFSRLNFETSKDFLPIVSSLVSGAAALLLSLFIFDRRDIS